MVRKTLFRNRKQNQKNKNKKSALHWNTVVPFLVERRRRLQSYMEALLRVPAVACNPDLRAFLSMA